MERGSVEAIVTALNREGARYLIAGGLAVVAHGYVRFTPGVDIVLDLEPDNVRRAIAALSELGYRPRAPVEFSEFADPARRSLWAREKGMAVFSLFSPDHSATEVDLFLEPPLDFGEGYRNSARKEVAPGLVATFAGRSDLVRMKRAAGRPQDLQDAAELEAMHRPPGEAG